MYCACLARGLEFEFGEIFPITSKESIRYALVCASCRI
jgi:hypothetical protein